MQVKRFEGVDMQEVLRLVKDELGPHAVILSTRHIKKGKGAFGMFGRPIVEVTAAVDREEEPPLVVRPQLGRRPMPSMPAEANARDATDLVRALDPLQRDMDQVKELLEQLATKERYAPQVNFPSLEREMNAVKRLIEHLVGKQQDTSSPLFPSTIMPYYQRMLGCGLEEPLARRMAEKVQNSLTKDKLEDERYVRGYFANMLVKTVPVSDPLRLLPGKLTAVALVGPTGVGKTTTIAKLAAHYTLGEKKKVALLTIDTYRIAAVEQLRTFAKIIGLSLDVVLTPSELNQVLVQHHDKDLVLIDTAGRSQRDALQMAELRSFFPEDTPVIVHLVLSATASWSNLLETVERFQGLVLASLVFTKLDETNAFGTLLGTALRGQIPLSYFTTGQRVPEDIEVATAERVVDLILNVSHWPQGETQWHEGLSA